MPYVSAMYAPPDEMAAAKPAGEQAIVAVDDIGRVWWLAENSEVGDWLRYVEAGGTVEPYDEAIMKTWQGGYSG